MFQMTNQWLPGLGVPNLSNGLTGRYYPLTGWTELGSQDIGIMAHPEPQSAAGFRIPHLRAFVGRAGNNPVPISAEVSFMDPAIVFEPVPQRAPGLDIPNTSS